MENKIYVSKNYVSNRQQKTEKQIRNLKIMRWLLLALILQFKAQISRDDNLIILWFALSLIAFEMAFIVRIKPIFK